MHILIGLVTAVAGLIWALYRLQNSGVDLNSFNPFTWYRRHQWQQKSGQNPLYNLAGAMESASVLVLGVAKLSGEITRETKQEILDIYADMFNASEKEALDCYTNSSFLLRNMVDITCAAGRIIDHRGEPFTEKQTKILMRNLERVSRVEGGPNDQQVRLLGIIGNELRPAKSQTW